ncbi:MAG: DNA polymerase III subunit delta [Pseudomonadota bacterium]
MIINSDALVRHLANGLHSYYWIHSDAVVMRDSAAQYIRAAAKAQHFEPDITYPTAHTAFETVSEAFQSPGLFAPKRFFEWRLEGKWPNQLGQNYAAWLSANPPISTPATTHCFLIVSDYITSSQQKTAWYKTLSDYVTFIPIWPPTGKAWSTWFAQEVTAHKLELKASDAQRLSDFCSEDPATAKQTLQRLAYAFGTQPVAWADIAPHCVSHSAEQDTFMVLDAILLQEADWPKRYVPLMAQQPLLALLGAITYVMRTLLSLKAAEEQGKPLATLLAQQPGGPRRKAALTKVIQHLSLKQLSALWQTLIEIDHGCKHGATTEATHKLYTLLSTLSGRAHAQA